MGVLAKVIAGSLASAADSVSGSADDYIKNQIEMRRQERLRAWQVEDRNYNRANQTADRDLLRT